MRQLKLLIPVLAVAGILAIPAFPSDADAIAIEKNIVANHMPFGTVIDPVYSSATGTDITGYTRCADSALWTGAFLAAEAFHYKVTQSPDALTNVKNAIAAIGALANVTGNNQVARCMFAANWQFAAGIESEEAGNSVKQSAPWVWIDNTSRDEIVGVFFGLGVAYDMVDDPGVKSSIGPLASRIAHFIADHQWSPDDDITTTFRVRPEELQAMLDVTRHVNPGDSISGPFLEVPFDAGVLVDIQATSSYFKFNLDYMSFYNLVRLNPTNNQYLGAYVDVRNYTANHQNPFFDIIDHGLRGANNFDSEIRPLLDQWLLRPKRDLYIDDTKLVKVCGSEACSPIPVAMRPTTDFIWQRDPFQLTGGGYDTIEGAGVDYILPYWMARFYGVIPSVVVQSAAAVEYNLAPSSIVSIYGSNLAPNVESAPSQPLPTTLGGASITVTDSTGAQFPAPLIYASPTQINFVVPDGTAPGMATFNVTNGGTNPSATGPVQAVAPTLFSADGSGTGVAAATAVQVQVNNPNLQSPVTVYQCGGSGCSSVPIALGVDAPIYLTLYGTGIRHLSSLSNLSVSAHGINLMVSYAGPAPGFTGLDQVNVLLDLGLRGAGEIPLTLTVDGQTANMVTINVQ